MCIFRWSEEDDTESNLVRFLVYLKQTIEDHDPDMKRIWNELKINLDEVEKHKS